MRSYRQIFSSTMLLGGTQFLLILLGALQTKILAALLGTAGMGISGLYQSAVLLIGAVTRFGINFSGVRQIAEAAGAEDAHRLSAIVQTLRWLSWISGISGMLTVLAFSQPLAVTTFGSPRFVGGMALMSLSLLFRAVAEGQNAVLQGMRKLRALAAGQALGAGIGAVCSILIVYRWREDGIAAYLVATTACSAAAAWWYGQRVKLPPVPLGRREVWNEASALVRLGVGFLASGLIVAGVAFAVRVMVRQQLNEAAVGLYTATWTLSNLYVQMVLQALGMDFFPRLTGIVKDHAAANRMINEQTEMGVILGLPGVIATLALAPLVLRVFYTEAFLPASDVIRWQIMGVALQIVSCPLGYLVQAKGMVKTYIATELTAGVLQVLFVLLFMRWWGLEGVGIAYFAMYVGYTALMLALSGRITGFRWSTYAKGLIGGALISIAVTQTAFKTLPNSQATGVGLAMIVATTGVCLGLLRRTLKSAGHSD